MGESSNDRLSWNEYLREFVVMSDWVKKQIVSEQTSV